MARRLYTYDKRPTLDYGYLRQHGLADRAHLFIKAWAEENEAYIRGERDEPPEPFNEWIRKLAGGEEQTQ